MINLFKIYALYISVIGLTVIDFTQTYFFFQLESNFHTFNFINEYGFSYWLFIRLFLLTFIFICYLFSMFLTKNDNKIEYVFLFTFIVLFTFSLLVIINNFWYIFLLIISS